MLVLKNTENLNSMFAELLADFRRTQVSRFPVEVMVKHENYMVFTDSRFPVKYEELGNVNKILGSVYASDDNKIVVESRLIKNDKYASHNNDYHTRKTQDIRKVLKYMKEYIKPYTAHEIANRTIGVAKEAFSEYKSNTTWDARKYELDDVMDLYEEALHMKTLGYEPKTEAFRKLLGEGFEIVEKAARIEDKEFPKVHVYVAPDETVTVSVLENKSKLPIGVDSYESLAAAPTLIQQHVGILKIMEDRSHVPDIGYKASATEFWIEGFSQ